MPEERTGPPAARQRLRILLVSHEASRSGAPRVAILVARALIDQGHHVRAISRFPGPLLPEFRATALTTVEPLHRVRRRLRGLALTRRAARAGDTLVAAAVILWRRPNVVYINSTAASAYVRPARWFGKRVVLHAHESAQVASAFFAAVHAPEGLPDVDVVACSPSVRRELASLLGRDLADLTLIPSVPDGREVVVRAQADGESLADTGELVIGCVGTVEARKGADLWVAAARNVLAQRPDAPLRFVWVGDIAEPVTIGAHEPIEFMGPSDNPYALMRRFDIGTLPSRDDPFPLVVLEMMLLGTPVVAFAVGGVPEQIGDAGVTVEAGDVVAFASALLQLIDDEDRRGTLGEAAADRAQTFFSVEAFTRSLDHFLTRQGER